MRRHRVLSFASGVPLLRVRGSGGMLHRAVIARTNTGKYAVKILRLDRLCHPIMQTTFPRKFTYSAGHVQVNADTPRNEGDNQFSKFGPRHDFALLQRDREDHRDVAGRSADNRRWRNQNTAHIGTPAFLHERHLAPQAVEIAAGLWTHRVNCASCARAVWADHAGRFVQVLPNNRRFDAADSAIAAFAPGYKICVRTHRPPLARERDRQMTFARMTGGARP